MRRLHLFLTAVLLISLIAGCSGRATPPTSKGSLLFDADFTQPDAMDGPRLESESVGYDVRTDTGVFQIRNTAESYAWALYNDTHTDIIIEADSRLNTDNPNNGAGVGCRMAADGSGYYFLVSRDGYYAILLGTPQAIRPLSDWAFSDAIRTGAGASNTIRATCKADQLTLTVNDTLLATVTDSTHTQGSAALIVSGSNIGPANVAFSRLQAWAAVDA